MKICFVNPTKGQRPIYMVAKKLADRGHTATILQPTGGGQRYPAWDNVQIIDLPCRYVPEARYTLPSIRLEYQILERLVQERGYDLIHVQDYQCLTALPPIWIKKRLGVPITLVNNALVGVDWQYGKWPFDQVTKLYTYTLGRFILRSYDWLFFLYHDLLRRTKGLLQNHPPMEVIPIGVDANQFHAASGYSIRHELGIDEHEKVLLFVGRLAAIKRVELILKLTQQLLDAGIPIRTVIVGGGSLEVDLHHIEAFALQDVRTVSVGGGSLEKHLRELARPLGKAVQFVGPVATSHVKEYYRLADALVLPSRSEGLPNVLLEAAACELPCVASDVGGISEIIDHGQTGYLFPRDDFEALVNYVRVILEDGDLARAMGQRAREKVITLFAWEKIVDRYEQVFRELVG